MLEEWRDIPNFEGLYKASSDGRIASYDRAVNARNGKKATRKGRILSFTKSGSKKDYFSLTLTKPNYKKSHKVHRLIALAFLGDPKDMTVDHIDGNKENNKITNLRYCTVRDNCTFYTIKKYKKHPCIEKLSSGNFRVKISISGKPAGFGTYKTIDEAIKVYQDIIKNEC